MSAVPCSKPDIKMSAAPCGGMTHLGDAVFRMVARSHAEICNKFLFALLLTAPLYKMLMGRINKGACREAET